MHFTTTSFFAALLRSLDRHWSFKFAVMGLDMMQMTWIRKDNGVPLVVTPELDVFTLMSPAGGARLFEGAARSYADVRAESVDGVPKGFPLAVEIEVAQRARHERRTSSNVAAALRGTDPILRDEYVILTAHLDHDGIGAEVDGDRPDTFNPHWLARDPRSNRLVLGAELGGEEGFYLLRFDDASGRLAFDVAFRGDGRAGYLSLSDQEWPHGPTGTAWGHAALFLPP